MDFIDLTEGGGNNKARDAAKRNAHEATTTDPKTTPTNVAARSKDANNELTAPPKQSDSATHGPIVTAGRTRSPRKAAAKRSYIERPNSDSSESDMDAPIITKRSSPRVQRRNKKIRRAIMEDSDDSDDEDSGRGINSSRARRQRQSNKGSPKKAAAKKTSPSSKQKKSPAGKRKNPLALAVGTNIRKRYNIGWYDGQVISSSAGKTTVTFPETDEVEELSDDDAVIGVLAYQLKHTGSGYQRPKPGTQVLQRYHDENKQSYWIDGSITGTGYDDEGLSKTLVQLCDGDQGYMTDDEAVTCAASYSLLRSPRGRKRLDNLSTPIGNSTNLLSLIGASGPSQRLGIGTWIRKQYETHDGKEWYDGKIVKQNEHISQAYFEPNDLCPAGYSTDVADDELAAYAFAYDLHHHHQPKKLPGVGTNVRVMYNDGWCNGTILSKTKNGKGNEYQYEVKFDDGETRTWNCNEDAVNYAAEYERYIQSVLGDETRDRDDDDDMFDYDEKALNEDSDEGNVDMQASNETNESADERTRIVNSKLVTPAVGLKIRKKFIDVGWCEGSVIYLKDRKNSRARIEFSDGQEQTMTYGEVHVTSRAYLLHQLGPPKKPEPGTRISRRYDQGWFDGRITGTDPHGKHHVLFDDGDEYWVSDEEAETIAMAYKVLHRYRRR